MANIYDVAKKAGVSKTLVSRVINDKSGVSQKARERILTVMKELNYRPNEIARSLVLQKTKTIGVVVDSLQVPYFFGLIEGLEESSEEEGYNIVFCDGRSNSAIKSRCVDYFTHHRVDGIIIYGSAPADDEIIKTLAADKFPIVIIENEVKKFNVNNILIDNFNGAYKATEHLIRLGYTDIAHFSGDMYTKVSIDRLNGYLQAMKDFNLPVKDGMITYNGFNERPGYNNMKLLLSHGIKPEAIFCCTDMIAFGVMRAILEGGLRIPENIAVVGFDDDKPESRDIVLPGLTTMKQPLLEIGKESVRLLIKAIDNPNMEPESILFPTELIIRESSEKKI